MYCFGPHRRQIFFGKTQPKGTITIAAADGEPPLNPPSPSRHFHLNTSRPACRIPTSKCHFEGRFLQGQGDRRLRAGQGAVVALLGADDFFGEGCLAGQPLRLSTASAMAQCVIVRIAKADITRVIHEEPAFAELFISHLLARNSRVEEDLVDQLFNSSEKRLARTLLLLANFGKEGRPEPIIAKISQETLAEMIGTTRSRVSFFMNKFRELGLIDYNGRIEVHSFLLNVVLRDQPQIKS